MTTEPNADDKARRESESAADPEDAPGRNEGAPGAEMGISEESASTFEPEEDPEGHN